MSEYFEFKFIATDDNDPADTGEHIVILARNREEALKVVVREKLNQKGKTIEQTPHNTPSSKQGPARVLDVRKGQRTVKLVPGVKR